MRELDKRILEGFVKSGIEEAKDESFLEVLKEEIIKLGDPYKTILLKRYGFEGDHQTLEQISKSLNITKDQVVEIEAKGVRKLNKQLKKGK